MKIVIDDRIPYIDGVFEPYAEVVYRPGRHISPSDLRDADALVTRTRTHCNEALLKGSKVRLIATATIGFDHIDADFCQKAGIEWVNAPGCNAESVNQYLASALCSLAQARGGSLAGQAIGVVGVGHVGSRVAATCRHLGMNVLLNDPPRARREGSSGFDSLDTLRETCDIISFHVPLERAGEDRTWHLVNASFFAGLKRRPVLINTCRGEVFDTRAVSAALRAGVISGAVVDCWEHEPDIDPELLALADFATPHIAGYSRDGKANGTRAAVRAISRFFGLGLDGWEPLGVEAPGRPLIVLEGAGRSAEAIVAEAILATYRIEKDDRALREQPGAFEQLRGDYPVRREFGAYSVETRNVSASTRRVLAALGFICPEDASGARNGAHGGEPVAASE